MDVPKRKLPRLKGYDYSKEGYYFITVCTHERRKIFGTTDMLNEIGNCVKTELLAISDHFEGVRIDKYVIMPDNIHMVIVLGCNGVKERETALPSISTIIGLFKSGVTRKIREKHPEMKLWQKSFFDTIIRNRDAYKEIVKYIYENPQTWDFEKYHIINKNTAW